MKKIGVSALCVLLAIFFVMSVFNYGTNYRYSFMEHVEFITDEFSKTPSVDELVDYWTEESFVPSYNGIVLTASGSGFAGGSLTESDGRIYPEKIGDLDDDSAFFGPIIQFFGAVKGFFVRAYYSVLWVCNFVVQLFQNIYAFMPWNGNVYVKPDSSGGSSSGSTDTGSAGMGGTIENVDGSTDPIPSPNP